MAANLCCYADSEHIKGAVFTILCFIARVGAVALLQYKALELIDSQKRNNMRFLLETLELGTQYELVAGFLCIKWILTYLYVVFSFYTSKRKPYTGFIYDSCILALMEIIDQNNLPPQKNERKYCFDRYLPSVGCRII